MHICHIYLSYFSVPYQPVVSTLGKFPNWHLFWSKLYFSIGKLWATIKISISAQLSIKSIFSNIISIGYCQNFTFGHILCSILHLVLCQMGNFHYFPPLVGMLAIKAMAICKILPFAPFGATIYILCIVKWEISTLFLTVWHIGYQSHGISWNFAFCSIWCNNLHFMYCQMGNFYYFSFCLICWLEKPWHFAKFRYLPTKSLPFLKCVKVVK